MQIPFGLFPVPLISLMRYVEVCLEGLSLIGPQSRSGDPFAPGPVIRLSESLLYRSETNALGASDLTRPLFHHYHTLSNMRFNTLKPHVKRDAKIRARIPNSRS